MKILAIVPARGGSKSIPYKNIKLLNGKPLISYTIETALKAEKIDKVVVSTDSSKIKKIIEDNFEIEIIDRPEHLSTDEATTESALLHACDFLKLNHNYVPDLILTLEPTAPFRSLETINRCINAFENKRYDSVVGLREINAPLGQIKKNQYIPVFQNHPRRRQDREPVYLESGTIWGTRYNTLIKNQSVLGDKIFPLIINKIETIDINDKNDFKMAQAFSKIKENI